jgi:hypothetical protein
VHCGKTQMVEAAKSLAGERSNPISIKCLICVLRLLTDCERPGLSTTSPDRSRLHASVDEVPDQIYNRIGQCRW